MLFDQNTRYKSRMDEDISTRPLTQADLDKLFVEAQAAEISPTNHSRKLFERNSMGAARSIINLALASPNDAIRLKAATYVIDRALGPIKDASKAGDPDDPWTLLAAECVQTMDPSDYERLRANVAASNNSSSNQGNPPESDLNQEEES